MSLMSVQVFSPEEIATHLKVTRRTVYRWVESGALRGVKAGKHWRICEPDLEEFLRWKTPAWVAIQRVLERQAGPELDADISRDLLGYEVIPASDGLYQRLPNGDTGKLPPYSTDDSAAKQLRDELCKMRRWQLDTSRPGKPGSVCGNQWFAGWSRQGHPLSGACAPTQALAICRAALKEHYISNEDLRVSMPPMVTPSEVLVREDRDQR
jgi:excisionase family DNA binding protein